MDLGQLLPVILTLAGGALGWLGKTGVDAYRAVRKRRSAQLENLRELKRLLGVSREVSRVQNIRAGHLWELLRRNHHDEVPVAMSYDRAFAAMFPSFTDEEREWQRLIPVDHEALDARRQRRPSRLARLEPVDLAPPR